MLLMSMCLVMGFIRWVRSLVKVVLFELVLLMIVIWFCGVILRLMLCSIVGLLG